MRTNIICNTQIEILGNCQGGIVVAANDALRNVVLAQPVFSGQFFQTLAGYLVALKRAVKPAAAGAAQAAETMVDDLVTAMRGLSRLWHTHCVTPHHAVVRVSS